jgi:hypothetical protein
MREYFAAEETLTTLLTTTWRWSAASTTTSLTFIHRGFEVSSLSRPYHHYFLTHLSLISALLIISHPRRVCLGICPIIFILRAQPKAKTHPGTDINRHQTPSRLHQRRRPVSYTVNTLTYSYLASLGLFPGETIKPTYLRIEEKGKTDE